MLGETFDKDELVEILEKYDSDKVFFYYSFLIKDSLNKYDFYVIF